MLIIASLSLAANVSDNSLWSLGGTKKKSKCWIKGNILNIISCFLCGGCARVNFNVQQGSSKLL